MRGLIKRLKLMAAKALLEDPDVIENVVIPKLRVKHLDPLYIDYYGRTDDPTLAAGRTWFRGDYKVLKVARDSSSAEALLTEQGRFRYPYRCIRKYLAFDGEYVSHNTYGQEGTAGRCKRTGLLIAGRQIGIEVASGTYRFISPEGVLPTEADRWYGTWHPAKFGIFLIFRDDDVPTNVYTLAMSYYPSKAILVRCLKGSATVPKPYWASIDTDGTSTTVDGYDAVSLSEGEYALFYDANFPKPKLGIRKIAFWDRYPKDVEWAEGISLEMVLDGSGYENPTIGRAIIALGFGPSLLLRQTLANPHSFHYNDPRASIRICFLTKVNYRSPKYVHEPSHRDHRFRLIRQFYLDDPNVDAGTWADNPDLNGRVLVIERDDGYFGWAAELAQHRADYSKVNEWREVNLFKFVPEDRNVYAETICVTKALTTHHNYDEAGNTTGFSCEYSSIRLVPGFTKPSSMSAWDGSAWATIPLSEGAWVWKTGYWATLYNASTDYGTAYHYARLLKFYTNWATSLTGKISSYDCKEPYVYVAQVADRDFSADELTGFKAIWRIGATEDYESAPPSPELVSISDWPDELMLYFTDVIEP